MRLTDGGRSSTGRPAGNVLFAGFLALVLGAEVHSAVVRGADSGGIRVGTDLLAAGTGAVLGALHLRAEVAFPVSDRIAWALEGEFYRTAPAADSFTQADVLAVGRFRPWSGEAAYLGAGVGFGTAGARSDGDATIESAGILSAEAGMTFRPFSARVYLEPFARAFAVFGTDLTAGAEVGFRVGWMFGKKER